MLTRDTVVVATQKQVFSRLDDEIVILSLEDGTYYGLNPVGAQVWELIQEPTTVTEICDQLLRKYDVDPQRCQRETIGILEDLQKHDLIEVNEPAESIAGVHL